MPTQILTLTLKTDKPVEDSAAKLRGFIGHKFRDYPILHHHIKEVGFLYTYPKVQYKILEGTPIILGIEEGAEVLKTISSDIEQLRLGNNTYYVNQIQINQSNVKIEPTAGNHQYRFLTPWLALNPENYKKFKQMRGWKEKKIFLNNILVGNILSMCKGLDLVVDDELLAHTRIEEQSTEYKGIPVTSFLGKFEINFDIPDFFGLGKGVSQGFGVVKRNTDGAGEG